MVQEHIQNITKRCHPHNPNRQWLSVRWLCCAQLFTETTTQGFLHRICYFCSLRFLLPEAHSMRPKPVWYHELKNRLFKWLVTKNCRAFSQGEVISDVAEEFHKLHISRNPSPCPLWLNHSKVWIHSSVAQAPLVTAPPRCQPTFNSRWAPTIQLYWKCHAQISILNVASISFCASTFFLLCFWTWDQPPCQQFRIKGESHGNYLILYDQC